MSRPTGWTRITDRLYFFFHPGVRVRVWNDEAGFHAAVSGAMERDFERLLKYLNELRPSGTGIVDARRDGKRIVFRVRGPISDDGLEQRLRNMLNNL